MPALTTRQKHFCVHYIDTLNATESALKSGYSKKSAYAIGSENLRKPQINAYMDELMADRRKHLKIDQGYVLKEIQDGLADAIASGNAGLRRQWVDMLARHTALYNDTVTVKSAYEQMSDDELVRAIEQSDREIEGMRH